MRRQAGSVWTWLDTIVDWLSTIMLVVIVAVSFFAVVSRYAFNNSLTWSEELTRYLFIWMVFLGTAISVRMRAHVAVDVFAGRLSTFGDRALRLLEWIATLAFAAFVGIPGWTFVMVGMSNLSPALELPMGLAYAAAVAGSVLIALYTMRRLSASAPDSDGAER